MLWQFRRPNGWCKWALALFVAYYNFCRVHMTLKTTPDVATGITEKPWSIRELLEWAAVAA